MNLLTADQLGEVLERTRQDLFRIETLPSYDTAMTTGDFRRWLDGKTEPTWEVRQPWLDTLAQWARLITRALHRVAADATWRAAEPFTSWWDRHPQHHRSPSHVA